MICSLHLCLRAKESELHATARIESECNRPILPRSDIEFIRCFDWSIHVIHSCHVRYVCHVPCAMCLSSIMPPWSNRRPCHERKLRRKKNYPTQQFKCRKENVLKILEVVTLSNSRLKIYRKDLWTEGRSGKGRFARSWRDGGAVLDRQFRRNDLSHDLSKSQHFTDVSKSFSFSSVYYLFVFIYNICFVSFLLVSFIFHHWASNSQRPCCTGPETRNPNLQLQTKPKLNQNCNSSDNCCQVMTLSNFSQDVKIKVSCFTHILPSKKFIRLLIQKDGWINEPRNTTLQVVCRMRTSFCGFDLYLPWITRNEYSELEQAFVAGILAKRHCQNLSWQKAKLIRSSWLIFIQFAKFNQDSVPCSFNMH